MSHIKVISQNPVLKTKLFDVCETELQINHNVVHKHIDVIRKPAVSVFPITSSYDIYLISQYRYLIEKDSIEAVAGFIDEGETPLQAAQRELSEEIGLSADKWVELASVNMSASVTKQVQTLFIARGLNEGIAHPEDTEDIRLIKMSLDEAVEKVINGIINTAATKIGILMIDKMRQEGTL